MIGGFGRSKPSLRTSWFDSRRPQRAVSLRLVVGAMFTALVVAASACSPSTTSIPEAVEAAPTTAATSTPEAIEEPDEPTATPTSAPDPTPTPRAEAAERSASVAELTDEEIAALEAFEVREVSENALGVKFDWSKLAIDGIYLDDLGTRSSFYEISWCRLEETEGDLNWARLDKIVDAAEDLDYELMIKIRVGSCWATGGEVGETRGDRARRPSTLPADLDAYTEFVTALVERYIGRTVYGYAIENEVNGEGFWLGTVDEFITVSEVGAAAVRAADPNAIILDSGLSSSAYGSAVANDLLERGDEDAAIELFNSYYIRRSRRRNAFPIIADADQLKEVVAQGQVARNIAYAKASADLARRGIVDHYQLHFYERYDLSTHVFDYLERVIGDVPIEVTEAGIYWPEAPSDAALDAETALLAASLLEHGAIKLTFLPLRFGGTTEEIRWGLLEGTGETRASGEIYHTLTGALGGPNPRVGILEGDIARAIIVGSDDAGVAIVNLGTPEDPNIELVQGQTPEGLVLELFASELLNGES